METSPQGLALTSSEELAGDIAPLRRALGEPEVLASLTALAELVEAPRPDTVPALRAFLERYRDRMLMAVELPAIRQAYDHAMRGEVRELVALDRSLAGQLGRSAFADASRHTGRMQLRRVRPLRQRTLQRYLGAVERGEATGWHMVVFGVLLALFSMPLRQGLVHFAIQAQRQVLNSAPVTDRLTLSERSRLCAECDAPVGAAVQRLIPAFVPRVVQASP
ncbi:MAG: hypothetical protein KF833_20670 [Verrucomicrobiae bacterium]|nr:hypothetical protein [Verrucomicrobiae bacterium]